MKTAGADAELVGSLLDLTNGMAKIASCGYG